MTASDISSALSNSLSLGSILILTALGLAITFGVMRVINMAHGDLLMLGAYTAVVCTSPQYHLNLSLFLAIPISFLVVAFAGWLLEVCLVRFLYGRPLDTLLATFGVGMILQETIKAIFGANLTAISRPTALTKTLHIAGLDIDIYRVFIVGVTALCLCGVY